MKAFALVMTMLLPTGESETHRTFWPSEDMCLGMTQLTRFSMVTMVRAEGLDPREVAFAVHCEPVGAVAVASKGGRVGG